MFYVIRSASDLIDNMRECAPELNGRASICRDCRTLLETHSPYIWEDSAVFVTEVNARLPFCDAGQHDSEAPAYLYDMWAAPDWVE